MKPRIKITNERELKQARRKAVQLRIFLNADSIFELLQEGVAPEIIEAQRRSVSITLEDLEKSIHDYAAIKENGDLILDEFDISDIGKMPALARLIHNFSQEDFANLIGLKQQQLQKYEAENFASIKLSSFVSLINALGIRIDKISIKKDFFKPDTLKVVLNSKSINHIIKQNWFKDVDDPADELNTHQRAQALYNNFIRLNEGVAHFRGKSSKNIPTPTNEHVLWLARIASIAKEQSGLVKNEFNPLDLSCISEILALSRFNDGPVRAIEKLLEIGIITVIEPNIPGMSVDGAAFVVNGKPVIGLTIRYDRLDNFWFTLLHELGHIYLHQSRGLVNGFVDNFDNMPDNEIEQEADRFALESVMPMDKWRLSPARLANKPESVQRLANILNLHESIIFGRIRKERGYDLFSEYVGQGQVRKLFVHKEGW